MVKQYTWEGYYIPGTRVLRNLFTAPGKPHGETDPVKFRVLEEALVFERMRMLAGQPIRGNFDFAHMKAIHGFLFQDVYEWAGQERTAPSFWDPRMSKERGTGISRRVSRCWIRRTGSTAGWRLRTTWRVFRVRSLCVSSLSCGMS